MAAVPGRVTSRVAQGTNSLLKEGAAAITGTDDVLDELFGVGVRQAPDAQGATPGRTTRCCARCWRRRRRVSVEAIARTTGRSAAQTRAALGRLEADGYLVRRDLGGGSAPRMTRRRVRGGRCGGGAAYPALPVAPDRIPRCSRSPARTPAAVRASRPT